MRRRNFMFVVGGLGAGALSQLLKNRDRAGGRTAKETARCLFADDFDGPAGSPPDPAKWGYDLGGGGWGNDELEIYTAARQNSFLDGNGNLVIRATRTAGAGGDGKTRTYHSARLKTIGRFSSYGGVFEARMKLDVQPGLWPAWWMLGANFQQVGWPACGEVDMLENYGSPIAQTSVHTRDNAGRGVLTRSANIAVDSEWHIWRVQWSTQAGSFTFYKDGAKYLMVSRDQMANWCFSSGEPMFLVLNLAVGGAAGVPPAAVQFPVDLLVDYVRVWGAPAG